MGYESLHIMKLFKFAMPMYKLITCAARVTVLGLCVCVCVHAYSGPTGNEVPQEQCQRCQ